ncbi:PREDICTED: hematopoietic SH2 domain-containing protein [Condylura cristata]|uniref:hematopoietic SH2 domain-containing protein n=1 Tax=Condylura cristata TaxID=143302 RepID=UPI000334318B|nr:PREDICTED: hematopoietic SH2 domain-containing protein [Condylura cristata]
MTETRKLPPPLPPRLDWFVQTQMGQLAQGGVPDWFHGAISREDAESLLESQPLGSFLIRVSHSHVGYTLSYKAQSCCRHFMIKVLDTGNFVIPGEKRTHDSLDALVTFHQQQPMWPHNELLTQPCGQKDPENVDYEDLFFYSNALAEEASRPAHEPSRQQSPSSCPMEASEQASPQLVLLHQPKERRSSAKMNRVPPEKASSSYTPKAPLEGACQKLWKNFKMLPQTGKKVQQQLKSHLVAVNLFSPWDARRGAGSQNHSGGEILEATVYTDSFASFPVNLAQPQDARNANVLSRKALRSASCGEVPARDSSWHHTLERSLSSQVGKPEAKNLAEPEEWFPEEYRPPPPFAPGYC